MGDWKFSNVVKNGKKLLVKTGILNKPKTKGKSKRK